VQTVQCQFWYRSIDAGSSRLGEIIETGKRPTPKGESYANSK
jgi:hypothetical protein